MNPGPRVQPGPEDGGGVAEILLVVLALVALGLAVYTAPDAGDVREDLRLQGIEVPEPGTPREAGPVSYWSYVHVRAQRDTLARRMACLRQYSPADNAPVVSLRQGLAFCDLDGRD